MSSRESERSDLLEVRANVFAANFLMPEEGVRQFVGTLGKGSQQQATCGDIRRKRSGAS